MVNGLICKNSDIFFYGHTLLTLYQTKILYMTKLKAFADDNRVENTVGNGENVGYQHFSPVPTVFSKAVFLRVVKSWDFVVKSSMDR